MVAGEIDGGDKVKGNITSPWKRSLLVGAIESIAILPLLPFIGAGNPWIGVSVFTTVCGLFYMLGMWAAPRMMRLLRWLAIAPALFIVFLLSDAYVLIAASAYMFSRGGKHQGEWQFLYWLGGFLFHLAGLLWIVRAPEIAGYVPLLWGSAFVSVALFLYSFQRQLVRDAAVYHKLITSETLKVGLITVSLILGAALFLSAISWAYVGERMVGPLTNFADSFKNTLTERLGPVPVDMPYPMPTHPSEQNAELVPTSLFIKIVWNVIGGFLMPALFLGMIGFVIYLNRKEIKAFLFHASEEHERESLPFTEERRSLREHGESAPDRASISKEMWSKMTYVQKVRTVYRLLVWRWSETGLGVQPYETPRELGVRMNDPATAKFMDTYSQVKYAEETKEQLTEEELERWYTRLNGPR